MSVKGRKHVSVRIRRMTQKVIVLIQVCTREASDGFHATPFISYRWIAKTAIEQTSHILVFVQQTEHKGEEAANVGNFCR